MSYVQISTEQIISLYTLKQMYPNVSFPSNGPGDTWLANNGFARLVEVPPPEAPLGKVAEMDGIENVDGEWRIKWVIRDMTQVEIDSLREGIFLQFNIYRDALLEIEITIELTDPSRTVILVNDQRTKLALSDKLLTLSNSGMDENTTMAFEAVNDWFDFNYTDYQDLRLALDLYTQKVFDAKRETEIQDDITPFLSWDDLKTEFDSHMVA